MATEVEDYCQLQHSLKKNANKPNFEQPRSQKARHRRNNRSETDSSDQIQPPTTDATETTSQELTHGNLTDKAQSPSTQLAIIDPPNVTAVPATPLPAPPPVPRRRLFAPLLVPKAPIAVASPFTRHPATKPVPARLPESPIEDPKAPSMVNAWNTTQSAWTQQSIKPRSNATSAPATALPPPPPVTPTVMVTPVPAAHIIRRSTPFQKPVAEPVPSRLPTTSAKFPKAPYESIVKPVQATQSTTRATSQLPLGWRNRSLLSEPDSQPGQNTSRVEAVSTKPYFYVPPRKLSTTLRLLDPSDWPDVLNYRKIARLFENGWKHQQKQLPKIKRIFAVSLPDHLNESYEEYKADDYAIAPWVSDVKAIIVAKVALGKSSIHHRTSEYLVGPPWGYDSVIGELGSDLSYDEQVVYQNAAIRPAYIVMYERPTSSPVTMAPRPAPQTTRSNMTTTTTKSSTSSGCTIM
ncbi:hypothetical protein FRC00_012015 [Tulasnella sp. 408]|nr:hypothetical protein FRC00_012015 [Tulasnella sp. 408]